MGEQRPRPPVTGENDQVAAAAEILRRQRGPLTLKEITERAIAEELIEESSRNTIRGRLSQHAQLKKGEGKQVVVPLYKRRGYMTKSDRLRKVQVCAEWVEGASAPDPLQDLVRELGGNVDLAKLLAERLDKASLQWLVETLPFKKGLAQRLIRAATAEDRKRIMRERREQIREMDARKKARKEARNG